MLRQHGQPSIPIPSFVNQATLTHRASARRRYPLESPVKLTDALTTAFAPAPPKRATRRRHLTAGPAPAIPSEHLPRSKPLPAMVYQFSTHIHLHFSGHFAIAPNGRSFRRLLTRGNAIRVPAIPTSLFGAEHRGAMRADAGGYWSSAGRSARCIELGA